MSPSPTNVPCATPADLSSKEPTDAQAPVSVYMEDRLAATQPFENKYYLPDKKTPEQRRTDWGDLYDAPRKREHGKVLEKNGGTTAERLQAVKEIADRYIKRSEG